MRISISNRIKGLIDNNIEIIESKSKDFVETIALLSPTQGMKALLLFVVTMATDSLT